MKTILLLLVVCVNLHRHSTDGTDAYIADYPYVLSLRNSGVHSCAASLIGPTRAVTLAFCVGSPVDFFSILGGTPDHTVENCETCVVRDVNFLSRHPNYNESAAGFPNDIAVIGFDAVSYNSNLQPISLSQPSDGSYAGDRCVTIGWGLTSPGGIPPQSLQQAQMIVLTNADCYNRRGALSITDGHICVLDINSEACNGDSGSPLECSNKLAGAYSWGSSSCSSSLPFVYTRISYFYSWIIIQ